ncbi:nuclear transport factor 2 family protein [Nonomuraea recticatena]|uniref:nuclear transport factor 2 family protein n=1 Tax=Nonomuraea recticatena TaxID=46178 RepID=UPI00361618BE
MGQRREREGNDDAPGSVGGCDRHVRRLHQGGQGGHRPPAAPGGHDLRLGGPRPDHQQGAAGQGAGRQADRRPRRDRSARLRRGRGRVGDTALARYLLRVDYAAGEPEIVRTTTVLRHLDGEWLIVHVHENSL